VQRGGMQKTTVRKMVPALAAIVLACSATPAAAAGKNPRDGKMDVEYVAPVPVTDPLLMGEWLMRLAGRYRVEGIIPRGEEADPVQGAADCQLVGAGPGLHCIFDIWWPEDWEITQAGFVVSPDGIPWLDPSMMLLGLDPARRAVNFMLVDNKGLPQGGSGTIAGERAVLKGPCANPRAMFERLEGLFAGRSATTCERVFRFGLRTGDRLAYLVIELMINNAPAGRIDMSLYRVASDDATPKRKKKRRREGTAQ